VKFALIGRSLSHSFSQSFFQNKFKQLNLEGYAYENLEYESDEALIADWDRIKSTYSGVNITIPYKKTLISVLDEVDEIASQIRAINCIYFVNGKSIGFNTDYLGFYESVKKKSFNRERKALILGNGGSAQAVIYAVKNQLNLEYNIVDRKGTDIDWDSIFEINLAEYSLIINTTPIGMSPNENECPELNFSSALQDTLFVDLIYNPMITQFLQNSDEQGCMILNGLPMLHIQAEESWKIWAN
jgi:shikimate dehydrogenase